MSVNVSGLDHAAIKKEKKRKIFLLMNGKKGKDHRNQSSGSMSKESIGVSLSQRQKWRCVAKR